MNIRGDAYLINYTKRNVYIISLVVSLCIFILLDFSISKVAKFYEFVKNKATIINSVDIREDNKGIIEVKGSNEKVIEETNEELIWQVEIPSIKLAAPISEGTSQEVMMEYVGHFENTSFWNGNIGLAAHNRGYPINYFARLKELKNGDKIIYKIGRYSKTYIVQASIIIDDTNWSYLQETKGNKITLITCVENKPNKRLCIQGVQIKEELN